MSEEQTVLTSRPDLFPAENSKENSQSENVSFFSLFPLISYFKALYLHYFGQPASRLHSCKNINPWDS